MLAGSAGVPGFVTGFGLVPGAAEKVGGGPRGNVDILTTKLSVAISGRGGSAAFIIVTGQVRLPATSPGNVAGRLAILRMNMILPGPSDPGSAIESRSMSSVAGFPVVGFASPMGSVRIVTPGSEHRGSTWAWDGLGSMPRTKTNATKNEKRRWGRDLPMILPPSRANRAR